MTPLTTPLLWTLETLSYAELRASGVTTRRIETALREGRLVRPRRDRYLPADVAPVVIGAVGQGARVDCVTLLSHLGIFVRDRRAALHLQFTPGASHLSPRDAAIVRHWRPTDASKSSVHAPIVEALAQACRCQDPRAAIATLDSAWHQGFVDEATIAEVFDRLPARLQILRAFLDSRSESGTESLMRLIARAIGFSVELQVKIHGVGRVDMVLDGWLVIECDSRAHHDGWEVHARDRRRDLALAARGYTSLRPTAEMILNHPDEIIAALNGIRAARVNSDAYSLVQLT